MKPGTTLARYRLLEKIGRGGMGEVWKATDTRLDREVAIKVLAPGALEEGPARERFRREARAASKIYHPNIVNVTDSGTVGDGSFFFVMEYIEGVELTLIKRSLERTQGNKVQAARLLNLKRTTLIEKLKRLERGPAA